MYVACEANLFGDFLHGKAIPFHDFLRLVYAEAVHVFHDPHAIFFFKHLRYVRGADIYLFWDIAQAQVILGVIVFYDLLDPIGQFVLVILGILIIYLLQLIQDIG